MSNNQVQRNAYSRRDFITMAGAATLSLTAMKAWGADAAAEGAKLWTPPEPANSPIGLARGIFPGRVVWAHDPAATSWDGLKENFWFLQKYTDQAAVDKMMARSINGLAGQSAGGAAWDKIFRHFNQTHDAGDVGYKKGEHIAIKVNMNAIRQGYGRQNKQFVTPHVLKSLVRQLVNVAKVPQEDIVVYDASRCISPALLDPPEGLADEFPRVRFEDNQGAYGRVKQVQPDPNSLVHFSKEEGIADHDATRLPTCLTGAKYLINLASMRGHVYSGVTLCAKNHFGSVWRPGATQYSGWMPDNLHQWVQRKLPRDSYSVLVDLMGHQGLNGKGLLFMADGLYAAHDQDAGPLKWMSAPFNDHWTSSLFVSQDQVALESVIIDFARSEPKMATVISDNIDFYLHEAALADHPPSGTLYAPHGDGRRLPSLGVHEHWNNAREKKYSRDLSSGNGIELFIPA